MRGGEEAGGNALRNILSSIFAEQGGGSVELTFISEDSWLAIRIAHGLSVV